MSQAGFTKEQVAEIRRIVREETESSRMSKAQYIDAISQAFASIHQGLTERLAARQDDGCSPEQSG